VDAFILVEIAGRRKKVSDGQGAIRKTDLSATSIVDRLYSYAIRLLA
jgi:hypothetical protein